MSTQEEIESIPDGKPDTETSTTIDRRSFLAQLSLAMGALAFGTSGISKADTPPAPIPYSLTQPNILVVMVDQLRYRELAGGSGVPSLSGCLPNITALQSQSIEFANFFVAGTTCTPSRASFMTGLYPPQTCMYITQGNGATPSLAPALDESGYVVGFPTFASYLQSKGYNTLFFGKWHLSDQSPDFDLTPLSEYGFTFAPYQDPSPDGEPNEGVTGGLATLPSESTGNFANDLGILREFTGNMGGYTTQVKPWCAVVSFINPHDISEYPEYLPNFCDLQLGAQPNWPPEQPSAAAQPTTNPPLQAFPSLPQLFTSTAATQPDCVSYSGWYEKTASAASLPSNVPGEELSTKPQLQVTYQGDLIATVGGIGDIGPTSPSLYHGVNFSPKNGDWGCFLNTYYWLAGCVDGLIGNLSSAYNPSTGANNTVLGYLAYLLAKPGNPANQNLDNTIIIFTSDHGELGGAHSLQGKGGSSYDEAIQVPFFVRLPGNTTHGLRNQMVSAVDFFGLLASFATYNPAHPLITTPWRTDNPQLATRENLFSMLINNAPNAQRVISSSNASLNGAPYILHTCNEFYSNKNNPMPYGATERNHVIGLRTNADKLVYYVNWADGASGTPYTTPAQASASNFTGTSTAEYYNYSSGSGLTISTDETTNAFDPTNSYIKAMQAVMADQIANELQAALPSITYGVNAATYPNGLDLQNDVLVLAQADYSNYIAPPTGLVITTDVPPTANQTTTFTVSATVEPGPKLSVWNFDLQYQGQPNTPTKPVKFEYIPEAGSGSNQPYTISYTFSPGDAGVTYSVQLSNPGSSYVYKTYVVQAGS